MFLFIAGQYDRIILPCITKHRQDCRRNNNRKILQNNRCVSSLTPSYSVLTMSYSAERITVTLPRELAKKARETAEKNFQPISKYIAQLINGDTEKEVEHRKAKRN